MLFFGGVSVILLIYLSCLFFDAFYGGGRFRTMQDQIPTYEQVDLRGLKELQASGGNTPRFPDVYRRLRHIKQDKIIVDAIGASHGYVKGIPLFFLGYTYQHSPSFRYRMRRLVVTGSTKVLPELVTSEAEEAQKYGFGYKHFYIGSKFVTDAKTVDAFIAFIESLPKDVWIHFHCEQGKGRTSTMLVMLDILKNAPQVTVENIVRRQHLLGSVDLFTPYRTNGTYTEEMIENRKKFVKDFYTFVCQRKAGGVQRWSEWYKKNRKEVLAIRDKK